LLGVVLKVPIGVLPVGVTEAREAPMYTSATNLTLVSFNTAVLLETTYIKS
jgi:hypothetical protein